LTCCEDLEELADALRIFKRSDHGNILIWANDDNRTLLWIDTKNFIRVTVAVTVAFIVNKNCVEIYIWLVNCVIGCM
jgi:hypothetical protein